MRKLWSPGWIASHLFALTMVVVMVNLGFWQLRRLDERQAANAEIAAAMARAPADVAEHLDSRGPPPDYAAVAATGVYRPDAEVLIANRSRGGQPGYWLATPLDLGDGRSVAVVRGWIPRDVAADLASGRADPPTGQVQVVGLAFGSVSEGRIGATAAGRTPEISRMDLDRFEQASGVEVLEVWIRLRSQAPPQPPPTGLPVPVPAPDLSDGPHLSYAFQWFFFSAGAVVVYGLILRRAATGRARGPDSI